MSKILAQSIFSIGRPHYDTRINASNVSSLNRFMQSLFTQCCLENPQSHIVVLAKPKLQLVLNRNCKVEIAGVIWNLEVSARVPRLESNNFYYLQIATTVLCNMQFLERSSLWRVESLHSTFLWSAQTKKTFLKAKMAFDRCWRLQYWTMPPPHLKNKLLEP